MPNLCKKVKILIKKSLESVKIDLNEKVIPKVKSKSWLDLMICGTSLGKLEKSQCF
jgi:hypothetical protein